MNELRRINNGHELSSISKELIDLESGLIKVSLVTYSIAISILCGFLKQALILGSSEGRQSAIQLE